MFTPETKAIIYGKHIDVAERMLDFDFLSGRSPSVAGFIDPNVSRTGFVKLFYGDKEILIPIYKNFESLPADDTITTLLNFASFRSATESTWEALKTRRFNTVVIVAEGIPERDIREMIAWNNTQKESERTLIIGPATAGAIVGGTLRMGNAGGSIDNIITSGLYRKGSIGFVSKSGGMSNEMYRVISKRTSGIHTGIALGGDRYTGSTFEDIIIIYESDPEISMIVMLGEVGGRDEIRIAELIEARKITKPVVAYVSGSFAEHLTSEVQFGHAGAKANQEEETASYKNNALRKAGASVPKSYADFGNLIEEVFGRLPSQGRKKFNGEHEGEKLSELGGEKYINEGGRQSEFFSSSEPLVLSVTKEQEDFIQEKLSLIQKRKSTHFTSTISDERGEDVLYNKKPLSEYIEGGSLGSVIGALWLKRDLPEYAVDFIDTVLILLADHGPAVSGATNSIITARAGKDILSSLVAGLMTIGPRFGGAIDGAARCFYEGMKSCESPENFITRMKKSGIPIPGIGHKVKSKFNRDGRCELLKEKVKEYGVWKGNEGFGKFLNYALEVEALTLEKKPNLILNVDGHIAVIFLDVFESIGMSTEDIEFYIDAGLFNAFFILARSVGFIGHALDQKRLGEPLYRTSWEDIHYE